MEKLKRSEKCTLTERVIQFGEGNFLRGFVDWMIDRLNKETGADLGVVVVQPRAGGHAEEMNAQDGLYTLYLRGLKNGVPTEESSVIECVTRGLNPYTHTDEFMRLAENENMRYIVSNTTEAGIEYKENQDENDFESLTFPAKLALLMKRRYDKGLSGFVVLPCELIDKNGDMLKKCVLKYADDWGWGDDFVRWVNEENIFANTLVDRIVTGCPKDGKAKREEKYGYTDAFFDSAELFHLWVIEGGEDLATELPFDKIGLNVVWTDDVTPYKKRKVRILNGAHTMTVPAALLAGLETVREAMEDEDIYSFMHGGIFNEVISSSGMEKGEIEAFAYEVEERFKNPFIAHYMTSIALNSVSKFKVRVLPSLLDYIEKFGKNPPHLIFSLAALICLYKSFDVNDAAEVKEFMKTASVEEILSKTEYWDCDLSFICDDVRICVDKIEKEGVRAAMRECVK